MVAKRWMPPHAALCVNARKIAVSIAYSLKTTANWHTRTVQKLDSCRLPVVVIQHSTNPPARLHGPSFWRPCTARNDDPIAQSLMVSFEMVMCNEFSNRVSQRIFTKENHLLQTTFFDRADESLRVCVQIRRTRRQLNGLDANVSQNAQKLWCVQRISIVDEITLPC